MVDRLVALGGSSGTVALSAEDTKRREKRLSIGVDTEDDDFDEEASEDSDEGWSDDEEEVTPRGPPSRANTPVHGDGDDDDDGQERAGTGEYGGDNSGQFLAPLPSRDAKLARVARSEDEAVAMMLRPNSRPSSRVFVAVELEEGIDADAVKKRVDEARSKMIKDALPESPSPSEKVDYHETDLFKKLQSMRDQQTVDDEAEAASLERSKAKKDDEEDDVEDDDEEGDEGEDDAAAPEEGAAADGGVVKEKKRSKKKKKKKLKEEEGSGATSPREKKSKKKKKTKEDGSGATSPREKTKKKAK